MPTGCFAVHREGGIISSTLPQWFPERTVVEIGRGQRPAGDVARLLAAPDRAQAGRTAPALGLFLMKVDY